MEYNKVIQRIETQLKDYIGNKKAIIGISGGIDSAVTAALCSRALGKDKVYGVLMPYAIQNMEDAKSLVEFLDIPNRKVHIGNIVGKFNFFKEDKITQGNIMARVRMTILYGFANELNGLVVGTSNKSEIETGYYTKYGDGGVDIEPLGEIYKTDLYKIAKILKIPQSILDKKPSAGLWNHQTDEDELGFTYKDLDAILKGEITEGEAYEKFKKLHKSTEHKRQMPPTFSIEAKK